MGAARELDGSGGVPLPHLKALVGTEVRALTPAGAVEGTLLSCTQRSAWIVAGDVDHLVALPHLRAIHRL
ncbi:MAG TPA: hypothetical protein VK007_10325 [Acidimicrobiales bacterium]|nr:hypothetical protein [Acidimicrobiales bacterium]